MFPLLALSLRTLLSLTALLMLSALTVRGLGQFRQTAMIAFHALVDGQFEIVIYDLEHRIGLIPAPHPATDLQPDWSPDGQWLVFTSNRDDASGELYRMRPTGGGLERLTNSPGFDIDPAWSPDGRWLAFISDRDSPNSGDLYLLDLQAGIPDAERLLASPSLDAAPRWSPDASAIVFEAWNSNPVRRQIMHIDREGANLRSLSPSQVYASAPDWSSDGHIVLMDDERALLSLSPQTHELVTLPNPCETDLVMMARWSSDSQRLAVSARCDGQQQLYLLEPDTGAAYALLSPEQARRWLYASSPSWHP